MAWLTLPHDAFDACNRAIVISGCARSGTTLLGRIVHSFDGIEYAFEPPALLALLASIETLPRESWMPLYESCLYVDVLLNALSGRNLNCNRADDSSVFAAKSPHEVHRRQATSKPLRDAVKESRASVVAYKAPDVVHALPHLATYYPGTRFVLLRRNPEDALASLVGRGWFHDDALRAGWGLWPGYRHGPFHVPHAIPEGFAAEWLAGDELHRAAGYYCRQAEGFRKVPGALVVDYDALVKSPGKVVRSLAEKLGLAYGHRTPELVEGIRRSPGRAGEPLLPRLAPALRQRIQEAVA